MKNSLHPSVRRAAVLLASGVCFTAATLLTGCGMGTLATPSAVNDPVGSYATSSVTGKIHGGNNPVVNATVEIFAAVPSNNGYGASIAPIGKTTSSAGGFYSFGTLTCPANGYAYVLAAGGNPSSTSAATDNQSALLGAAIGPCATLAGSFTVINELTTVALAEALDGFMPAPGSAGITVPALEAATTSTNTPGITTSTTNAVGLKDAFANAYALVNPCTGTVNATTQVQSTTTACTGTAGLGVVPVSLINTLGDILQACVNTTVPSANTVAISAISTGASTTTVTVSSTGSLISGTNVTFSGTGTSLDGNTYAATVATSTTFTVPVVATGTPTYTNAQATYDSYGCDGGTTSTLLTAATPTLGSTTLAAPLNTLQAAQYIALYPGLNVAHLLALVSSTGAAFQPFIAGTTATTTPNDLSVSIAYNPTGTANSGTGTSPALIYDALGLTVDKNDNLWIAGSYAGDLLEFGNSSSTAVSPYPGGAGSLLTTTTAAAVSSSNCSATLFPNQYGALAANTCVTGSKGDNFRYMAFDQNSNLFLADGVQSAVAKIGGTAVTVNGVWEYSSSGTPSILSYASAFTGNYNTYAIAADLYGNVWTQSYKKSSCGASGSASVCQLLEMSPAASFTAADVFSTFNDSAPDANGSRALVVDSSTTGKGNIWTSDIGSGTVSLFKTTLNNSAVATAAAAPATVALPAGTTGSVGPSTETTYGIALDKNSNAWVVGATLGNLYELSTSNALTTTASNGGGLSAPAYDVIDGNNNVFIANLTSSATYSAVVEYNIANSAFVTPNDGLSPNMTFTAGTTPTLAVVKDSSASSVPGGGLYQVSNIAVDKAGALWALGSGTYSAYTAGTPSQSTLLQILGVAAPTDPVLADGVYGTKP